MHGACQTSLWARSQCSHFALHTGFHTVPTESTSAICAQRVQALPAQLLASHRSTPSTDYPCLAPRVASSCIMEQQQQAAHSAHARLAVLTKHIAPVRLPVRRSPFCSEGAPHGESVALVPAWAQPTSACAAIAEATLHLSRCCTSRRSRLIRWRCNCPFATQVADNVQRLTLNVSTVWAPSFLPWLAAAMRCRPPRCACLGGRFTSASAARCFELLRACMDDTAMITPSWSLPCIRADRRPRHGFASTHPCASAHSECSLHSTLLQRFTFLEPITYSSLATAALASVHIPAFAALHFYVNSS